MTNLEWLHSLEPRELSEWFAAEHVESRTCRIKDDFEIPHPFCSECGAIQPEDYTVYYCFNCGAKVVE